MQSNWQNNLENSMVLPWGNNSNNSNINKTDNNYMSNKNGTVDVRSYQEMLLESVGKFIICRFLVGSENLISMAGILKNVGNDFFILEDPCTKMYTTCDLYSVKFISVTPEEFTENIPSYCRRRLYDGIFEE